MNHSRLEEDAHPYSIQDYLFLEYEQDFDLFEVEEEKKGRKEETRGGGIVLDYSLIDAIAKFNLTSWVHFKFIFDAILNMYRPRQIVVPLNIFLEIIFKMLLFFFNKSGSELCSTNPKSSDISSNLFYYINQRHNLYAFRYSGLCILAAFGVLS